MPAAPSAPAQSATPQPPRKGEAASKVEHAVRHASDGAVAPQEKRAIGAETSREEDA